MAAYLEKINVEDLTLDRAKTIMQKLQESSYDLAELIAAVLMHTIANEEGVVMSHEDEACPVRVACEMLVTLDAMETLDATHWQFVSPPETFH